MTQQMEEALTMALRNVKKYLFSLLLKLVEIHNYPTTLKHYLEESNTINAKKNMWKIKD